MEHVNGAIQILELNCQICYPLEPGALEPICDVHLQNNLYIPCFFQLLITSKIYINNLSNKPRLSPDNQARQ